ncbi:hypothetical protein ACUXVY_22195 [Chromobacterium haemolyticum]|uniref:hypothetical protein n=1 Tax=Chromobacterium haemolyticum TaxID=394935 RepID=UPI004055A802
MKKEILQTLFQTLDTISFFENFNTEETDSNIDAILCKGVAIFEKSIHSEEWEDIRVEAAAQLSTMLNKKFQNQYQEWNAVAKEARQYFDEKIEPKLKPFEGTHGLKDLKDDIEHDIVHIIIEGYFTKRIGIKKMLFSRLFDIYKSGKIPCGYSKNREDDFIRPTGKIIYL